MVDRAVCVDWVLLAASAVATGPDAKSGGARASGRNGIARHVLIGAEAQIVQGPVAERLDQVRESSRHGEIVPLKQLAREAVREKERSFILEALQANQWNRRKAAQALKISYRALIYKIRDAGLFARRDGELTTSREKAAGHFHPSAD